MAMLDEVFTTGEPFVGIDVPFTVTQGGKPVTWYLDMIYQPTRDANGTITGIFAEGHDITAHHEARERVEALQAELIHGSRSSAMNIMGSALAHELNQPLTSIGNYVSGAQRIAAAAEVPSALNEALAAAVRESRRAGHIIRKLREMTMTGKISKTGFDLDGTVREAARLAAGNRPGVRLRYELQSIGTVEGDPIQLQQVLINLVRNSCEAAEERPLLVTIAAARAEDAIEISVSDDGPGIDEAILPVMFESFTSSKDFGMGVGLSICRTIVEAHGGRITARNNEGGGATVSFTIPSS